MSNPANEELLVRFGGRALGGKGESDRVEKSQVVLRQQHRQRISKSEHLSLLVVTAGIVTMLRTAAWLRQVGRRRRGGIVTNGAVNVVWPVPAARSNGPQAPACGYATQHSSLPPRSHPQKANQSDENGSRIRSAALGVGLGATLLWLSLHSAGAFDKLHTEGAKHPPDEVRPIAAGDPEAKLISMEEVEKHNSIENGIWIVIQGEIYEYVCQQLRRRGDALQILTANDQPLHTSLA